MTSRYFVPVSTGEYAKLYGISERTARRRVASLPGAVKSAGSRWVIPIPASTYSRLAKISPKAARRRSMAAPTPQAATAPLKGTLRQRAEAQLLAILQAAPTKRDVNPNTVHERMDHSYKRQQLNIPVKLSPANVLLVVNDQEWLGNDDESILYYH